MSAGFGNGSFGFLVFDAGSGLPDDWQERLRGAALPALGPGVASVSGWTGCRHALDKDFTDDGLMRGGYPTGMLVTAERHVPASTLAEECALEELAVMQAEGKGYLNLQARSEIKRSIQERLLPDMPVVFRSVEWVCVRSGVVYCTATSESAVDAFLLCWRNTFGVALRVLDPEGLAESRGYKPGDWPPVAFGLQGELFCESIGSEFLMWLWRTSEKCGGLVAVVGHGEFVFVLEGPLVLSAEGKMVTVKSETAVMDVETAVALAGGLTLQRCRFTLVRGAEVWVCKLDAAGFVFRSMKLPPTEAFDRNFKFAERVALLEVFHAAFSTLFGMYCRSRSSEGWKAKVQVMNDWIAAKHEQHQRSRVLKLVEGEEAGGGGSFTPEDYPFENLKKLGLAADLTGKLYARREGLQRQLPTTYQHEVAQYTKLVRIEMGVSGTNAIKAALDLAKDMEKMGSEPLGVQLQLVAGLEVHEEAEMKNQKPEDTPPVDDELVEQAIMIIRVTKRASISGLQRRLKIGYTRASQLMDLLEEKGVVGAVKGNGPREILIEVAAPEEADV